MTTLSAGVMRVLPGDFNRAEAVATAAAAAKHKAKQLATGVYVDQRAN